MSEIDTDFNNHPVCPHCGAEDECWWDGLEIEVWDGTEWTTACPECDESYGIYAHVEITFSTRKDTS